jgi:hypothetical protein
VGAGLWWEGRQAAHRGEWSEGAFAVDAVDLCKFSSVSRASADGMLHIWHCFARHGLQVLIP